MRQETNQNPWTELWVGHSLGSHPAVLFVGIKEDRL